MDKQLFTSEEAEPVCDTIINFYECTLKVPVGNHPVGSRFSTITLNFEEAWMELYGAGGDVEGGLVGRYGLLVTPDRIIKEPN